MHTFERDNDDDSASSNSVLRLSNNNSEIEQSRFGLFGPDLFSALDDDDRDDENDDRDGTSVF